LLILDRVRVFPDPVADVLPSQTHCGHHALGRQLERQIAKDGGERRQRRCVAGQRRRGRPGGERAGKRGADGLARPRCGWRELTGFARPRRGWRKLAGNHERGHGSTLA